VLAASRFARAEGALRALAGVASVAVGLGVGWRIGIEVGFPL